ncbi:hypothetical protein M0802_014351 [Mischocyttarus mexicanus]|nr:hypothetical protein M0802_014351 [Mischocyttarus mexicanus]
MATDRTLKENWTQEACKLTEWTQQFIHGRYSQIIQASHIDKTQSYNWLIKGQLHLTIKGFAIAIQD